MPLTTTITVSRGAFSAIDSGRCTAFGLGSVSTPPEFESRKKIRIVNTSISETRFMSTIVLLRPLCSARRCRGVSFMAFSARPGPPAPPAPPRSATIGASPIEMLGK